MGAREAQHVSFRVDLSRYVIGSNCQGVGVMLCCSPGALGLQVLNLLLRAHAAALMRADNTASSQAWGMTVALPCGCTRTGAGKVPALTISYRVGVEMPQNAAA